MIINSTHSPKEYLSAIKSNMSGHLELGQERFTGFFLGRLFYVTYHSGYEWNRRITNQKNAAMGYVKRTDDGCEVRFMRFRGALCPLQFLPLLLIMLVCSLFLFDADPLIDAPIRMIIGLIATVIVALITAFIESMTEGGIDGRRTLLSMLVDPEDPYANYRNV